jgi:hypothetical protein
MMVSNVGLIDRWIRVAAASAGAMLIHGTMLSSEFALMVWGFVVLSGLSALVAVCPLYWLSGVSTCGYRSPQS